MCLSLWLKVVSRKQHSHGLRSQRTFVFAPEVFCMFCRDVGNRYRDAFVHTNISSSGSTLATQSRRRSSCQFIHNGGCRANHEVDMIHDVFSMSWKLE